jgi:hypothetical protein
MSPALLPSDEKLLWSNQVKMGYLDQELLFTHCNVILISLHFEIFSPCGIFLGMYRAIMETCLNSFSTFMTITPCGLGPTRGLDTLSLLNFNKNLSRSQAPVVYTCNTSYLVEIG